jgi:hypothetical protein
MNTFYVSVYEVHKMKLFEEEGSQSEGNYSFGSLVEEFF